MASVFFALPLAASSAAPGAFEIHPAPKSPRQSLSVNDAFKLISAGQLDQVASKLGDFVTDGRDVLAEEVIKDFFTRSSVEPNALVLQNKALSELEKTPFRDTVGSNVDAAVFLVPILDSLMQIGNTQGILRFADLLPAELKNSPNYLKTRILDRVKDLLDHNDQETAQALVTAFNLPPLPTIHEEALPLGESMTIQLPEMKDRAGDKRCVTKGLEVVARNTNSITVRAVKPGHHAVFVRNTSGPGTDFNPKNTTKIQTPAKLIIRMTDE